MLDQYLKLNSSGHFFKEFDHYMRRAAPMDYLLIWVLSGKGFARCQGRRMEVGPGHLLLFRPRQAHEYGADPAQPWDILWVHFQGKLARAFAERIREFGQLRIDLGVDDELRDRWIELVIAHGPRDPRFAAKTNTALYALLGLIIHRLQQRTHQIATAEPLDVHRLQTYVHQHLAEPITLADLARQANLSPMHFTRVFKKQFGTSPIDYVIQKRITHACALLTETARPLKQIATAVGYADPFYFSRLFRKVMAVSPSTYRSAATRR
ncbi:MAG: helix-turn-helix domain-containing protein [Verrucomicrobiota bacterium]